MEHSTVSMYLKGKCRCDGCKQVASEYYRAYYASHPGVREQNSKGASRRQAAKRAMVAEAKSRPCTDCGVQYPPYVMQFDHVPGRGTKEFNLAAVNASVERITLEIAKCDVVCANCHMERTHNRPYTGKPRGAKSPFF